ncbi:hypothetical protein J4Q44_G00376150, partial [Coregonus suidteri]
MSVCVVERLWRYSTKSQRMVAVLHQSEVPDSLSGWRCIGRVTNPYEGVPGRRGYSTSQQPSIQAGSLSPVHSMGSRENWTRCMACHPCVSRLFHKARIPRSKW